MNKESHVGRVISSGFWLYLSSILSNLQGFFYWLIITRIAGGEVVGIVSATVGISSLVSGMINLGIYSGLSRFIGYCMGIEKDKKCASEYFWTSIIFSFFIYFMGSISVLGISYFYNTGSYSSLQLIIASLLVLVGFMGGFSALLSSMLRTKEIFISVIIAAILKFLMGVALVFLGFGWLGAALGYVVSSITQSVINAYYTFKIIGFAPSFDTEKLKELIRAGIPSWLPGVIASIGQWLGVILLYGSIGSLETGTFFIASQLANVVLMISNTLNGLLVPVLSGLSDGRKRVGSRVFKISLSIMLPISFYLMVYPTLFLNIFGKSLSSGALPLVILLSGSIPIAFSGFVSSLVFAYGDYRTVLYSGLFANVPRVLLYILLVPQYSGVGAAISYTIGSFIGSIYLYYVSRKIGLYFDAKTTFYIIAIPSFISATLYYAKIEWFFGILLMALSYIVYIKMKVITREDLRDVGKALLGQEKASLLYEKIKPLLQPLLD